MGADAADLIRAAERNRWARVALKLALTARAQGEQGMFRILVVFAKRMADDDAPVVDDVDLAEMMKSLLAETNA